MTDPEPWRTGAREAVARVAEAKVREVMTRPPWYRRREVWLIVAGFAALTALIVGLWLRGNAESTARDNLTTQLRQPVYITVPYHGTSETLRCRLAPDELHGNAHYFCSIVKRNHT